MAESVSEGNSVAGLELDGYKYLLEHFPVISLSILYILFEYFENFVEAHH